MDKFTYENQGTHTYLVYTIQAKDPVDSMSLGMLTNNKISGLAHALFTQMDATKYIKYDVSAKISVKQFFSGQVNKKRLLGVFNGIVDAMLSAEDYMIDVDSILLDLDYIFADVTTCETVLVCLPIENESAANSDLGSFFKNIMFSTQFDPTENCDHVAKIINYLNSSPVFSLEDFKKVLDSISGEATQAPTQQRQQPVVQKQPVTQAPVQNTATQPTTQAAPVQTQQKPTQTVTQAPVVNQPKVQTPPPQQQVPAVQPQTGTPEKKISIFGLLMHYSAENAALYKAQKEAKKKGQVTLSQQPTTQAKPAPKGPQTGFAIPGQAAPAVNQGFAVSGQSTPTVQQTSTPKSQPTVTQPQQVSQQSTYKAPVVPQGQATNFGETTVLGGGGIIGETTVLGATSAVQPKPHLIRAKNNERINLDKPVFRIGKEKSYVDYFIGDNSAISRSHANIISRDGNYFVVDTNSTNHTYVNGTMIQSNVETPISHGAKIKLANEDFEFRIY